MKLARHGTTTGAALPDCVLVSQTDLEKLEAEIERLRAEHERALAKVDGVDYREGHFRDNTIPDELRDIVLGLAIEVERLRGRTHEIQEAADKRNAKLQSEHERYLSAQRWATLQLAAFRKRKVIALESEFDRLCVLNLRDEWQATIDRLCDVIRELRSELLLIDRPTDLQDSPAKHAAWLKKYDAETEGLCSGRQTDAKPTEGE